MSQYDKMHIRFRAVLQNTRPVEGRAMQSFAATADACMSWIKAVLPKAVPDPAGATPTARLVEMVDVERAVLVWDETAGEKGQGAVVLVGKCEFCPASGEAACCVCGAKELKPGVHP
jgi:hypothetical protein